jgi:hypothetical protein
MFRSFSILMLAAALACLGLAGGCGKKKEDKKPLPAAGEYLLSADPGGAAEVLNVKEKAEDGQEVVVIGRVGGEKKPLIEGRAAFNIVDSSLFPCDEAEKCPTPWDYCCTPLEELTKATLLVRVVDAAGQTIELDEKATAKDWLGIEPLQTLVVRGTLQKDKHSISLKAKGIFIKK